MLNNKILNKNNKITKRILYKTEVNMYLRLIYYIYNKM